MVVRIPNQKQRTIYSFPRSFVALDMETTGFDRINDKIIEIGAVRFTDGEPVAIFNTLVKQDVMLSAEITNATGHTTEDIQKGMAEEQAIDTLVKFIGQGVPLVAHNVLFDYEFYYRAFDSYGYCGQDDLIDTLTISRERSGYPHKLPDMCKKYNVPQDGWHSAYFDALACGQLLLAMHAEDMRPGTPYPEGKQVMDYLNVIGWKRQYGEPTWSPPWVELRGQGNVHVHEGPNVRRGIVVPSKEKPAPKWFGERCKHQVCQYETDGAGEEDRSSPVLVFCNSPNNPQDSEGNCYSEICPLSNTEFVEVHS